MKKKAINSGKKSIKFVYIPSIRDGKNGGESAKISDLGQKIVIRG